MTADATGRARLIAILDEHMIYGRPANGKICGCGWNGPDRYGYPIDFVENPRNAEDEHRYHVATVLAEALASEAPKPKCADCGEGVGTWALCTKCATKNERAASEAGTREPEPSQEELRRRVAEDAHLFLRRVPDPIAHPHKPTTYECRCGVKFDTTTLAMARQLYAEHLAAVASRAVPREPEPKGETA